MDELQQGANIGPIVSDDKVDYEHHESDIVGQGQTQKQDTDRQRPTVLDTKEKTEHHTLTARDVVKIFEDRNCPRHERSIVRWCRPNKKGIFRLDCYFDDSVGKYYITPQSVQRTLKEELVKISVPTNSHQDASDKFEFRQAQKSDTVRQGQTVEQDTDRQRPTESEETSHTAIDNASRHEIPNEHNNRIKDLEKELIEEKILHRAKDIFIDQLKTHIDEERMFFEKRQDLLIEKLSDSREKIGQLETRLLQPGRIQDATVVGGENEINPSSELYDKNNNNLNQDGINPIESQYKHANEGDDTFNV